MSYLPQRDCLLDSDYRLGWSFWVSEKINAYCICMCCHCLRAAASLYFWPATIIASVFKVKCCLRLKTIPWTRFSARNDYRHDHPTPGYSGSDRPTGELFEIVSHTGSLSMHIWGVNNCVSSDLCFLALRWNEGCRPNMQRRYPKYASPSWGFTNADQRKS